MSPVPVRRRKEFEELERVTAIDPTVGLEDDFGWAPYLPSESESQPEPSNDTENQDDAGEDNEPSPVDPHPDEVEHVEEDEESVYVPPPQRYVPPPRGFPPTETHGRLQRYFPSWESFIEAAWAPIARDGSPLDEVRGSEAGSGGSESWIGGSVEQAKKWAALGWLEGAEQAQKYANALFEIVGSFIARHDVRYGDTGHFLDVARFAAGEPEAWGIFEEKLVEGPSPRFFTLQFQLVASGGVSSSVLLARAAVAASLIEAIEYAGHRCQVSIAFWTPGRGRYGPHDVQAVIKQFDEPLDLPKIAYAVGHPTVLRRHWWALAEREPKVIRESFGFVQHGGYGGVGDIPSEEQEKIDVYFPCMRDADERWSSPTTAVQWTLGELKKLGITLSQEV